MKIEQPHLSHTLAVGRFGQDSGVRTRKTGGTPQSDDVQLSSDSSLAKAAADAATPEAGVRADRVAEARTLLDQGEIGKDLEALANRILADLTGSYDDPR